MIRGYEQFKEDRDMARNAFRAEMHRQMDDDSLRGRSVWKAFVRLGDQNWINADGTPRSARDVWKQTYRECRKNDAEINKSIAAMTNAWASVFVEKIYRPRRIDQLLGI